MDSEPQDEDIRPCKVDSGSSDCHTAATCPEAHVIAGQVLDRHAVTDVADHGLEADDMVEEDGLDGPGVGRSGEAVEEGCKGGVGGSEEGHLRAAAEGGDKVGLFNEGRQCVESLAPEAILEGASSTPSRSASALVLTPVGILKDRN